MIRFEARRRRASSLTGLLGLVLTIAWTLASAQRGPAGDETQAHGVLSQLPSRSGRHALADSRSSDDSHQNVLIVTLLDGRIIGVDSNNGAKLWSYDSGAPLVSVRQVDSAGSTNINIFPGLDGSLYAYHGMAGGQPQLERLSTTLPELVSSSPSVAVDGSVVLGTRMSTVFALNKGTGQLVRLLSGVAGALMDTEEAEGVQVPTTFDPHTMVLVGREDFIVRSLHAGSGQETWNATFARFMQLDPFHAGAGAAPDEQRLWGQADSQLGVSKISPSGRPDGLAPPPTYPGRIRLPHLAVAADNTLQAYDIQSGFRRWSVAFDAPPVAAFDTAFGGDSRNQLDPSTRMAGRRAEPLPQRGRPRRPAPDGLPDEASIVKQVLVGVLDGSLYAIPTDHLVCAPGWGVSQPKQGLPGGHHKHGAQQPQHVPALPYGGVVRPQLPTPSHAADSNANTSSSRQLAVAVALNQHQPQCDQGDVPVPEQPSGSTALAVVPGSAALSIMSASPGDPGTPPVVSSLMCPLGVHPVTEPHRSNPTAIHPRINASTVPWLPAPASKPPPMPQAPEGPGLLPALPYIQPEGMGTLPLAVLLGAALLLIGMLWLRLHRMEGRLTKTEENMPAATNSTSRKHQDSNGRALATLPLPPLPSSPHGSVISHNSTPAMTPNLTKRGRNKGFRRGSTGTPIPVSANAAGSSATEQSESNHSSNGINVEGMSGNKATNGLSHVESGIISGNDTEVSSGFPVSGVGNGQDSASNHSVVGQGQLQLTGMGSGEVDVGSHGSIGRQMSSSSSSMALQQGQVTRVGQPQPDGSILMGRLRVGPGILGYGSAGTIVYEGWLDGRPVAVKRLLRQFYDLARKEIEVLILSDEHPNVVRCFAMEEDREFVYLALERCKSTLADALAAPQAKFLFLDSSTGGPSQRCLEICRQVVMGLAALHERGIVHRDLKPHNVLLTDGGRAKLSDMGLSKQLVAEQSSFESHGAGGSSGWQAPEQLIARGGGVVRQSRSMDVFSMGCVLYYCMTGGKHPYGTSYERDAAIMNGAPNMAQLACSPEACNLVQTMLTRDAEARPVMTAVLGHPIWWTAEQSLKFLVDISDRVENEDREPDQRLLAALEAYAQAALQPAAGSAGTSGYTLVPNWGGAVEAQLVVNLGRYRRYDYTSLRDLLRVVRNKRNHFREMPSDLQVMLGPLPHGFLKYFTSRFPNLLMSVWVFAVVNLADEDHLASQYYHGGAQLYARFVATFQRHQAVRARPTTPPTAPRLQPSPTSPLRQPLPATSAVPPVTAPAPRASAPLNPLSPAWDSASAGKQVVLGVESQPATPVASATGAEIADATAAAAAAINGLLSTPVASPPSTPRISQGQSDIGALAVEEPPLQPQPAESAPLPELEPALSLALVSIPEVSVSDPPPTSLPATMSLAPSAPITLTPALPTPPLLSMHPTLSVDSSIAPPTSNPTPATTVPSTPTASATPGLVIVGYEVDPDPSIHETIVREFPRRPGRTLCDFFSKTGHCKFGESCVFDHPLEMAVRLTPYGLPLRPDQPVCSFYTKFNECKFGPSCKFHHPILRPVYAGQSLGVGVPGGAAGTSTPATGTGQALANGAMT